MTPAQRDLANLHDHYGPSFLDEMATYLQRARRGLSVFNTVIEPGWKGFLTLELVYYGWGILRIPAGAGIAQVLFHWTTDYAAYDGKYMNQPARPVSAILEKG